MKREGGLWDQLTSFRNLLRAAERARRGKRDQPNVARFDFHLENELFRFQTELKEKTYAPERYRTFTIYDPKKRLISEAPFRDRVVHHALCGILEPIFERGFIFHSYACRRGKGTHAAVDRFEAWAERFPYVLQGDVAKFFHSIDHEVLKGRIRRRVKRSGCLMARGPHH